MASKAIQQESVSSKLINHWEQVCEKLSSLAEAIPENKFDFQPVDTVRTPAEVLRHVAYWNRYVADSAHGRKGDDSANELPKDEFRTKKQILAALKDTASGASQALKKNLSNSTPMIADMLVSFIEHNSEHYGQLVVYARMNGITPPASRS